MRNLAIQVHELFSAKIAYLTNHNDFVEEYSSATARCHPSQCEEEGLKNHELCIKLSPPLSLRVLNLNVSN